MHRFFFSCRFTLAIFDLLSCSIVIFIGTSNPLPPVAPRGIAQCTHAVITVIMSITEFNLYCLFTFLILLKDLCLVSQKITQKLFLKWSKNWDEGNSARNIESTKYRGTKYRGFTV